MARLRKPASSPYQPEYQVGGGSGEYEGEGGGQYGEPTQRPPQQIPMPQEQAPTQNIPYEYGQLQQQQAQGGAGWQPTPPPSPTPQEQAPGAGMPITQPPPMAPPTPPPAMGKIMETAKGGAGMPAYTERPGMAVREAPQDAFMGGANDERSMEMGEDEFEGDRPQARQPVRRREPDRGQPVKTISQDLQGGAQERDASQGPPIRDAEYQHGAQEFRSTEYDPYQPWEATPDYVGPHTGGGEAAPKPPGYTDDFPKDWAGVHEGPTRPIDPSNITVDKPQVAAKKEPEAVIEEKPTEEVIVNGNGPVDKPTTTTTTTSLPPKPTDGGPTQVQRHEPLPAFEQWKNKFGLPESTPYSEPATAEEALDPFARSREMTSPKLRGLAEGALEDVEEGGGLGKTGRKTAGALEGIIERGGQLDEKRMAQRFETQREFMDKARRSQMNMASGELAQRGMLSESGIPQGPTGTTIGNIEQKLGEEYAGRFRDIGIRESELADDRMNNALSLATGLGGTEAKGLIDLAESSGRRQEMLSDIANDSLDRNIDWSKFLATHGLQRDALVEAQRQGRVGILMKQFDQYLEMTKMSAGGYVG